MFVVTFLLTLSAWAGGRVATRCEASWEGPSDGCDLNGSWAASGYGPSEARARAAALDRLGSAMSAGRAAAALRLGAEAPASSLAACTSDARLRAHVTCLPTASLSEDRFCYLDLADRDCWTGGLVSAEGVAWRVNERDRDRLCADVEERLVEVGAPALQRATCQAECQQDARVRCPEAAPADDAGANRPRFLGD